ncbi:uncharacterized protein H6S33_001514 [Morchella sextelata]|uniref:uncharacterized protein n=1 Tax=Morchella sextelata TaxID=1174677 RepID=UPI001D03F4FB|nr:uncharacterized protein H6S33_001514 [Morchella sextelata]KAH0608380.1 hypothetical protein H6S33_001514 [Morchella sextelata]
MMPETPTQDQIDIDHLQGLLSKDAQLAETQIICSPPRSPPLVPRTPAKQSSTKQSYNSTYHTANDHSGNLHLAYSNNLSYSQVDLGETQADDGIYPAFAPYDMIAATPPAHRPATTGTFTTVDELESQPPEPSTLFPEAHRFVTPQQLRSKRPVTGGHNPLQTMTFGGAALQGRMNASLAQMFDSVSSPIRPINAEASLPPTPSAVEAMGVMAKTLERVNAERDQSSPVPAAQAESEPGPKKTAQEAEDDEYCEPTQPDQTAYISMKESQEARDRKAAKKKPRRLRSHSPVVFEPFAYILSQPGSTQKIPSSDEKDCDEDSFSPGEDYKRRVERARRKGEEEVKRLFAKSIPKAPSFQGRARSEEDKRPIAKGKSLPRATKSVSPIATLETSVEETGDEEDTQPEPAAKEPPAPTATAEDENEPEPELPLHTTDDGKEDIDIAPTFTSDVPTQIIPAAAQTQYTQLPPDDWESLHQIPAASKFRRRPAPPLNQEGLMVSSSLPSTSAVVEYSQPLPVLERKTTSLKSLVPFNIPSPVAPVPEYVKETSGLMAPTSSLTPIPSGISTPIREATVESSPMVDPTNDDDTPLGKRKRPVIEADNMVPCSVEESGMKSFKGLEETGREHDPGDQAAEGTVMGDKGNKRIRLDFGKGKTPKPKEPSKHKSTRTPASKSKTKITARKTRSSISVHRSMSSLADTDDDADILTTTNPHFHVSVPPPPGAPTTVPSRVFALFRDGKTAYYPATILESNDREMKVVFDDGTEDLLSRDHIRSLDLRIGDHIRVDVTGMKKSSWVIDSFKISEGSDNKYTDSRGNHIVTVKGKVGEPIDVAITSVYLIQTMWKNFSTRTSPTLLRQRTPSELSPPPTTPSHRRLATPLTTGLTRNASGVFTGMIFALSFGANEAIKKSTTSKILSAGGRIVDIGFNELFYDPDTSLTLRPEFSTLGFTAVIADTHCRRAKFLQALALGLPCLASRWIDDCVKKSKLLDWEHYLLPAGESRYLGCVCSRTLETYDLRRAAFSSVLERRKRLLDGMGVIVVGSGEKRRSYLFLTWAMGAERVIKVGNLEAAGRLLEGPEEWDYVCVEAKERGKAERMYREKAGAGEGRVQIVDDEWIVQSLIFGRLVDED